MFRDRKPGLMFTGSHRFNLLVFAVMILTPALLLASCRDDDDGTIDTVETPIEQPGEETPTPDETATTNDEQTSEPDEATPTPSAPTPQVSPTPEPTVGEDDDSDVGTRSSVLVYLARDELIGVASRDIAPTQAVATAAVNELLSGTTGFEQDMGLHSEVPIQTHLLGISIEDGVAIVDLSGEFDQGGGSFSMTMRVAQIVFTVTQFDTVDAVQFRINGRDVESIGGEGVLVDRPLSRDDFADLTPAILVESPTPGEVVSSPLRLAGSAMTFEATVQIEVVDNSGQIIYEGFITATVDTGMRGYFDLEIPIELTREGFGSVIVFEESARDGSRINLVEIPVDFRN